MPFTWICVKHDTADCGVRTCPADGGGVATMKCGFAGVRQKLDAPSSRPTKPCKECATLRAENERLVLALKNTHALGSIAYRAPNMAKVMTAAARIMVLAKDACPRGTFSILRKD